MENIELFLGLIFVVELFKLLSQQPRNYSKELNDIATSIRELQKEIKKLRGV